MLETNERIRRAKSARSQGGVRITRAAWCVDRRTRTGKRLHDVLRQLAERFGINPDIRLEILRRAAELTLISEETRRAVMARQPHVTVGDMVKAANLASRAARDLGAWAKDQPDRSTCLADYLGSIESDHGKGPRDDNNAPRGNVPASGFVNQASKAAPSPSEVVSPESGDLAGRDRILIPASHGVRLADGEPEVPEALGGAAGVSVPSQEWPL